MVLLPMFIQLKALLLSWLLNDHFPCKARFLGGIYPVYTNQIAHNIYISIPTYPPVPTIKTHLFIPKQLTSHRPLHLARTTPGFGTRITTIAATSGPTASPPPPASAATAWWSTAIGRSAVVVAVGVMALGLL